MSMYDAMSSGHFEPPDISPEFIKSVENELFRRLGQRVTLTVAGHMLAVRVESKLGIGDSVIMMALDWLLYRKRPEQWADLLERKIKGEETFGRLSGRAEDVERLFATILAMPSPAIAHRLVLQHVDDYDNDFFEALAEVIARDKAYLRFDRVPKLEALQKIMRNVRERADRGETAEMWKELNMMTLAEMEMKPRSRRRFFSRSRKAH
jgi:hypothetical protein